MLYIVRHGRTAANAGGRIQGRLDLDLDDFGRSQAARLGAYIGKVDRVITSPLRRAVQTAGAFSTEAEIEIDERWIELDYGALDGAPLGDVSDATWSQWYEDPTFVPAGGESLADLQTRVEAALAEVHAASRDRDIVVVSHVSPIKAAIAWCLGGDPLMSWRTYLEPAAICRIGHGRFGRPVLRTWNERASGGVG